MPELPEVETVKKSLEPNIVGATIESVELRRPNLRIPFNDDFMERLEGRKIIKLTRRSKYIIVQLDNSDNLIIHLGMSGVLKYLDEAPSEIEKHDHVIIQFSDNSYLIYNDYRRFGLMTLTRNVNEHDLIKNLGVEPLTENFTGEYLYSLFKGKKVNIKQFIMNAKNLVGVGNIYASESLFQTGILPTRTVDKISKKEAELLVKNIKAVLLDALDSGGSSLRDFVSSNGDAGYFQHKFFVYGREGESCFTCGKEIIRIVQSNRSSFYCPKCQA